MYIIIISQSDRHIWLILIHRGPVILDIIFIPLSCFVTLAFILDFSVSILTPSLPQPVKFPGWKKHGHACKQIIFRSYNFCINAIFWWKSFHMPVRRTKQKGLRVSNFAFSLAIFKRHPGSEGVNEHVQLVQTGCHCASHTACKLYRSVGHCKLRRNYMLTPSFFFVFVVVVVL